MSSSQTIFGDLDKTPALHRPLLDTSISAHYFDIILPGPRNDQVNGSSNLSRDERWASVLLVLNSH